MDAKYKIKKDITSSTNSQGKSIYILEKPHTDKIGFTYYNSNDLFNDLNREFQIGKLLERLGISTPFYYEIEYVKDVENNDLILMVITQYIVNAITINIIFKKEKINFSSHKFDLNEFIIENENLNEINDNIIKNIILIELNKLLELLFNSNKKNLISSIIDLQGLYSKEKNQFYFIDFECWKL